jgi:hypothetical protein
MSWTIAIKRGDPQRELKKWGGGKMNIPNNHVHQLHQTSQAHLAVYKKKYSDKTRKKANSLWIFSDIPYAPS